MEDILVIFDTLKLHININDKEKTIIINEYTEDLNIPYFMEIKTSALKDAVDMLNGIEVNLSEKDFKNREDFMKENNYIIGVNHINSDNAIKFCYDRNNKIKLKYLKKIVKAIIKKVNIGNMGNILDNICSKVYTNIPEKEVAKSIKKLQNYREVVNIK